MYIRLFRVGFPGCCARKPLSHTGPQVYWDSCVHPWIYISVITIELLLMLLVSNLQGCGSSAHTKLCSCKRRPFAES